MAAWGFGFFISRWRCWFWCSRGSFAPVRSNTRCSAGTNRRRTAAGREALRTW